MPPDQHKPANWFSCGCYALALVILLGVALLFLGVCSGVLGAGRIGG